VCLHGANNPYPDPKSVILQPDPSDQIITHPTDTRNTADQERFKTDFYVTKNIYALIYKMYLFSTQLMKRAPGSDTQRLSSRVIAGGPQSHGSL